MKKKLRLLWIPVGIGLLILLIHECTKTKPVFGKRFEMTCTKDYDGTTEDRAIKSATFYFDNSGSMKGYTDFAGYPNAKQKIVPTTSKGLSNIKALGVESIRIECGNTVINNDIAEYSKKLSNNNLLSGSTTELGEMLNQAINHVSDTSISILVTDMVLSYGQNTVKNTKPKNYWYNKAQIETLGSVVYDIVLQAKNKTNVHFLIMQYLSDFNGKHYCNCTENLVWPENNSKYYDSLMINRPYYIVVIGKKQALKSIIANQCFKDYSNIYTTFGLDENDFMTQPFSVKRNAGPWALGTDKNENGCLVATTNKDEAEFEISFDPFTIPRYVNPNYHVGQFSSNIQGIMQNSPTSYSVTLYPCNTKYNPKTALDQAWFTLESANGIEWAKKSSIDDDVSIKNLKDLEGKTWGLNAVMDNIDKAYFPQGRPKDQVAKIEFNIVYKK